MDRRAALGTVSRPALVSADGVPLPLSRRGEINIPDLPLIQNGAFDLPRGIEARLCKQEIDDDGMHIVLWSPQHEVAVWVPLSCMDEVESAARMMANALPGRRRRAA